MTTLAFLALALSVPACLFLAWQMWRLSRELNQDQRNGYKLPRTKPKWLEDATWKETRK